MKLQFVNAPSDRFPFSHGSSLVDVGLEQLVCTWFSGSLEGHSDVVGLMSTLDAANPARLAGPSWSPPSIVAESSGHAIGNPVLFPETERHWHLFYVRFAPRRSRETEIWHGFSRDAGHSWEAPQHIPSAPGYWVRHRVIVADGRWLLPVCNVRDRPPSSQIWISSNGGGSWQQSDIPSSDYLIQPCLVAWPDGTVEAYLRDMRCRHVFRAFSGDGGLSWGDPVPMDLPNNNSGIAFLRDRGGGLIACYNDTRRRDRRSLLTVARSSDRGQSWENRRVLVPYRHADASLLQYSYPSLVEAADGDVHVTFTHRASRIAHVSFPQSWLSEDSTRLVSDPSRDVTEIPLFQLRRLARGEPVYFADKLSVVEAIPEWLAPATAVCPVNSRETRESVAASLMELAISRPATLFVAYDKTARRLPAWLDAYQPVGGEIVTTEARFSLYSRNVGPGTHWLGGNRQHPCRDDVAMYFAFVLPRNLP